MFNSSSIWNIHWDKIKRKKYERRKRSKKFWASKRAYVAYMYVRLMNKSYQLWPPNIVQFSCFLQNMREEDIWKIIWRKNINNIFVPHPSIFVDRYAKYLLQIKNYRYEEVDVSSFLLCSYLRLNQYCWYVANAKSRTFMIFNFQLHQI